MIVWIFIYNFKVYDSVVYFIVDVWILLNYKVFIVFVVYYEYVGELVSLCFDIVEVVKVSF